MARTVRNHAQIPVDHLVVAAPTLQLACEYVADQLGVPPEPGGPHPGRGTRNALLGLGNGCYLEAIGPDLEQPDPNQPRAFGIDVLRSPRLVTWALRTSDINAALSRLTQTRFASASAMSRTLSDGSLLDWQLAFPLQTGEDPVSSVPFLIDWGRAKSPGVTLEARARVRSFEVCWTTECEEVVAAASASSEANNRDQKSESEVVDFGWSHESAAGRERQVALCATIATKHGDRALSS